MTERASYAEYLIETVTCFRAFGICELGLARLNDRIVNRAGQ